MVVRISALFLRGKDKAATWASRNNFGLGCVHHRIWNYNKSRPHSLRGARDVEISLDGRLLFSGEVARAPGTLEQAAQNTEVCSRVVGWS